MVKLLKSVLLVILLQLLSITIYSQNSNCSDFSILGYGTDTLNPGNSVLYLRMQGQPTDFINYPYISVVLDCNGDTVGTGTINFFGQLGQSVQSYPVAGNLSASCLPLSVEFIYGNSSLENDTCILSFNSFADPLTCSDFSVTGIESDQSNTLVNITIQGTENSYITNPGISFVKDCNGDTLATGFINYTGQIGLSEQGYPITPLSDPICYPLTIEFSYSNTNGIKESCSFLLDTTTGLRESYFKNTNSAVFPNPFSKTLTIEPCFGSVGKKFIIYSIEGKILYRGSLLSEKTSIDTINFSKGLYFFQIDGQPDQSIKIIKE